MVTPWDFFIAYWLLLYAAIIGTAFLIIVVIAAIDGIRTKIMGTDTTSHETQGEMRDGQKTNSSTLGER